jgi:hypothetical protein
MCVIFSANTLKQTSKLRKFTHILIINFLFSLGLIANSHLAFADQLPCGARDEKCLKLARMHRYIGEKNKRF